MTPVDHKILLEEITLETLLACSPKETLKITIEDQEWLNATPVGEEI